jgi:hypothetical protein
MTKIQRMRQELKEQEYQIKRLKEKILNEITKELKEITGLIFEKQDDYYSYSDEKTVFIYHAETVDEESVYIYIREDGVIDDFDDQTKKILYDKILLTFVKENES